MSWLDAQRAISVRETLSTKVAMAGRSAERDPGRNRWHSGLLHLCDVDNDDGDCACVAGACVCPCVGYAWNYAVGVQGGRRSTMMGACVVPCVVHVGLDAGASALAVHLSGIPYVVLPVGTLLRIAQRHAVEREGWTETCVEECFCWGCSIGEVNRRLREREREGLRPYDGNGVLGTLCAAGDADASNHMRLEFGVEE